MMTSTPFIVNVPAFAVAAGNHPYVVGKTVLIQIADPDREFPIPSKQFEQTFQFHFNDSEKEEEGVILFSEDQANRIIGILEEALNENMNVVVHCAAGKCRSGAVAEIGCVLGFADTGRHRTPNLFMKNMMMRILRGY